MSRGFTSQTVTHQSRYYSHSTLLIHCVDALKFNVTKYTLPRKYGCWFIYYLFAINSREITLGGQLLFSSPFHCNNEKYFIDITKLIVFSTLLFPGLATSFLNDKNRNLVRDLVELISESKQELPGWLESMAAENR